jgi:hypothetical protein
MPCPAGCNRVPESAVPPPDTNDFQDELEGKNLLASWLDHRPHVAGVRANELRTTPDRKREVTLLDVIEKIRAISTLTSSFAFDIEDAGA